ncbi:unnamed protein product [Thlaspi arvense]|uniref:Dof zinc finger protein n=1 Tax=Thlaspi arvense TaxID=13288 RepID=A0AAU9TA70_THLAR|nr:unnamed protein product [Thlaspi arvense]
MERKRKRTEEALNKYCPRCNSKHTKFCYYNNYSLTQPRYLCKTCRRYWTHGGSLRTIPVGGASRKNKSTKSCPNNDKPEARGDQDLASSQGIISSNYELTRPALGFSLEGRDPPDQEEVSNAAAATTTTTSRERHLLSFESLNPPFSSPSSNGGIKYNHSKRNTDDKEEQVADRSAGFWSDMFGGESWQLHN